MLIDFVVFVLGLAGLYIGAEWLIGGAVRLATALGVSSFIVGLTLVSFGTSAPELVVSGMASYGGNGGLAMGNVLGSNVANIALILGVSALLVTIHVRRELLTRDLPIMVGVTALVPIFGWSGDISRAEGIALLVVFVSYTGFLAYASRRGSGTPVDLEAELGAEQPASSPARDVGIALIGLAVLSFSAHFLVGAAIDIATALRVPDVVIGLTLVAVGTSLPELAASVSAARRREGDIVVGNIVGSNIFNILLILGVSAVIRPLPVSQQVLLVDAPIVLGISIALVVVVASRMRLERWEGSFLLASYAAFLLWTAL